MRIAIGGIMHESNTFATAPTDRRRFEEGSLTSGQAILDTWREAHHEMGGFIGCAGECGCELVPTVMAWATPGGPVADDVLDEVVDGILERTRQAQPDGLLLALHGAMVTPERPDADTEVLRRLRAGLGHDLPLVVTLDYHANVTPEMAGLASALVGYQTYPHVDQRACGLKAARLLERTVRGEIRPVTAISKPPLAINLLGQETDREPMRWLMGQARDLEQRPGVLSVSLMAGFPYADVPAMGPSVMVVADRDETLAREVATELGDRLFEAREALNVPCPEPGEAVRQAIASDRRPVVLVDLGDNIGGGSPGDSTILLEELLRQQARAAVVTLYDPAGVALARSAGAGGEFHGQVGGKSDDRHGSPVLVHGRVRSLHDGKWVEDQPRHGGRRFNDQGESAVIDLDNNAGVLVLNSLRTPPFSLGQLTSLGIEPAKQSILVVKAAVAYRAAYGPIAGEVIAVDTPGLTAIDPRRFTYQHRRRPMFPWEA